MTWTAARPATGGRGREHDLLDTFEDADASLLERRALQTRVDRKFILSRSRLPELIALLRPDHRLLRAAGHPAASYDTLYFDTPDLCMFDAHRRGRLPRFKVRVRHQMERALTFVEIKRKGHDGRTVKTRLGRPFADRQLEGVAAEFVAGHSPFAARDLEPALTIAFTRATLLAVSTEERLTIDWGFDIRRGDRTVRWPALAIVEIKQPRLAHVTPALTALRTLGIREAGMSKFCVGLGALSPAHARTFRHSLRDIARLSA